MTSRREKKYNRCQASYPHSRFGPQVYDFLIAERAGGPIVSFASLFAVGEGILFGATLAWSEPLTALLRSAQSRVSSSRSLCKAATRTPSRLPFGDYAARIPLSASATAGRA